MVYLSAVLVTGLNLGFWVGILFNLPATWLMVLVTALLKWWQPGYVQVSWTVLGVAAGLAVLAEVLECVLGAAGSRRTGAPHGPRRWPLSAASSVGSQARHSQFQPWAL
jgi:hypothetical protein